MQPNRRQTGENAVAYIRVSTEEQARHGYSLETQREALRDYAKGHGLRVVTVYEEKHSAHSAGRPVFDQMCREIAADATITSVLVYKIDRLTRNLTDFTRVSELLRIKIISATEQLPDDATGRAMAGFQAVIARMYSDQLGERVRHGLKTKADKGLLPGRPPDGYMKGNPVIVPDPERASVIRELFDAFDHPDMSLSQLKRYADERGLRTKNGQPFGTSSLRYTLTNPTYCGQFVFRGELYEGKHQPIVAKTHFDRVQRKIRSRVHVDEEKRFPYLGMLTCHRCDCSITKEFKKGRYIYYRCTGGRGDCAVKHQYVTQDHMGEMLAVVVGSVHLDDEQVRFLLEVARSRGRDAARSRKAERARLTGQLGKLRKERRDGFNKRLDGTIDEDFWADWDANMERKIKRTETRIEELKQEGELDDLAPALELLNKAPELYEQGSHQDKARILKSLVWNCGVDVGSVHPHYKEPFGLVAQAKVQSDLPGGLIVELESFQLHGRVGGSKRDPSSTEHFGTPLAEVGSGAIG